VPRWLLGPLIALGTAAACLVVADRSVELLSAEAGRDELRIFAPDPDPEDADVLDVKRHFEQTWRSPEFAVRVRTNGAGLREERDFPISEVDVAFFGDSFVFGHGVEHGERISDLVGRALGGPLVASLAYPNGFTTAHYRAYAERRPELAPSVAVVGLYLGNDLDVDTRETRAVAGEAGTRVDLPYRSVTRQGHLIFHDAALRAPFRWLRECSALGRLAVATLNRSAYRELLFDRKLGGLVPNGPNATALDSGTLHPPALAALDHLAALSALIERRGGHLIALLIPQNFYVAEGARPHGRLSPAEASRLRRKRPLQRRILRWCAEHGVDCIDPTATLAADPRRELLYFRDDAHWTPLGHAAAAAFLLEHPAFRELLPRSPESADTPS
jgi:hypothetical protein